MRSVIVFRNSEFISIKQMIPLPPPPCGIVLEFSILFYFHFKEVGQVIQLSTYFCFLSTRYVCHWEWWLMGIIYTCMIRW